MQNISKVMVKLSKGEVDRLGNRIRVGNVIGGEIKREDIELLQDFRTSHQKPLAEAFQSVCDVAKNIDFKAIATYRIKRFQSIINKLSRFPKMRFSRMWDIAGCRIIMQNEEEAYEMYNRLLSDKRFEVVKHQDYYKNTKDDGYKSIHLYLRLKSHNLITEVQIRSNDVHDWATLVEISDLLFGTSLKELGNNKEFKDFHLLLSYSLDDLDIENKKYIVDFLEKKKYFIKLSEVFSRNYLIVRAQWLKSENITRHNYFLIEVKDSMPDVKSFEHFADAEKEYYRIYQENEVSNTVLVYLQSSDYTLLTTAYANYILSYHVFLYESLGIIESLIYDYLKQKKYYKARKIYSFYNSLILNFLENIVEEVSSSIEDPHGIDHLKLSRIRLKEYDLKKKGWIEDIHGRLKDVVKKRKELRTNIYKALSQKQLDEYVFRRFFRITDKIYNVRFNKPIKRVENLVKKL